MRGKKLEENLGGALRFIIKNFGENSLLDTTHVMAMMSELRPNLSKESQWLKEALDMDIIKILLDNKNTDDLNRKIAINKAKLIMKENYIPKKRIKFILANLKYGLKWPKKKHKKINIYIKEIPMYIKAIYQSVKEIGNNLLKFNLKDIKSKKLQENDHISSGEKKKYNSVNPLLVLVFIGIIGTTILISLNPSSVDVKKIIFDTKYEKDESTYVFKKGDFVIMDLALESDKEKENIDKKNLSYAVDDASVCKVSNEFEKCRITGVGVGTTTIHIYYDNKLIKNIDISFEKL